MLKEDVKVQNHPGEQAGIHPVETLLRDDVLRLIDRLKEAEMLKSPFVPPTSWMLSTEVPISGVVSAIQEHLAKTGVHAVLEAMRCHNRRAPEALWDLSRPADFLPAVELALSTRETMARDDKREDANKLLTAYFVSLSEAEQAIARRASALAQRQIALEGERAEITLNRKALPELMDALCEVNPLREGFLRERVRHRSAEMVGSVIAVLAGMLWGVVEAISDVLIAGISRYAPVVAPPLLVSLITLVAQTSAQGVPLTLVQLAEYLGRALWNGTLALGANLVVYGCWQYFQTRKRYHAVLPRQPAPTQETQGHDVDQATGNAAR